MFRRQPRAEPSAKDIEVDLRNSPPPPIEARDVLVLASPLRTIELRPTAGHPQATIVLLGDDADALQSIMIELQRLGHHVGLANGTLALSVANADELDLAVLDGVVPPEQRLEVFRHFHDELDVPVVVLDSEVSTTERVLWLALGASDVLNCDVTDNALAEALQRVLSRPRASTGERLSACGLVLDTQLRTVEVDGASVQLTRQESLLLHFLMSHPGVTFSREALLEQVWGHTVGGTSTVPVHIRRLREKIETDPAQPSYIITIWGAGYSLHDRARV